MKKIFSIVFKNLASTLSVIPKKLELKFIILIFASIFVVIAEALSFSIFIPLFDQIFNNGLGPSSLIKKFLSYFSIDDSNYIKNILLIILIVFILKSFVLIIINKFKISFEADLEYFISNQIIKNFVNQDLESYKQYEESKINKELILDIIRYIGFIDAVVVFSTEILVMTFIIIILMSVDFYSTTIIVLTLFLLSTFYLLTTRRTFKSIGDNAQNFENKYIHSVMEVYNLYKEIKIFDLHKKFLERTTSALQKKIKNNKNYKFYILLPRIFLELAIIIILCITFFILFNIKNSSGEIFLVLGLLSVATIRIMPSIVKCINSINTIKYCDASVNIINKKLQNRSKEKDFFSNLKKLQKRIFFKNSIELKNINFKYKDANNNTLNNINITINSGDYIGVVGPSGSGKSTLLDIIMLLQKNFSGTYLFDGQDVKEKNFFVGKKFTKNFGYVGQDVKLINDTIKKNITFVSDNFDEDLKLIQKTVEISQLKKFISDQPKGLDTIILDNSFNISGGQKQRIGIARAIYAKSPILLLDEITSALDTVNQEKIMKEISFFKKQGITVIQTTHNQNHYKYFDKIIDLNLSQNKN